MTFQEAARKLDEIAGDRYHSLRYELTTHRAGNVIGKCSMYVSDIDGGGGFWTKEQSTWEAAIAEILAKVNFSRAAAAPEEAPI